MYAWLLKATAWMIWLAGHLLLMNLDKWWVFCRSCARSLATGMLTDTRCIHLHASVLVRYYQLGCFNLHISLATLRTFTFWLEQNKTYPLRLLAKSASNIVRAEIDVSLSDTWPAERLSAMYVLNDATQATSPRQWRQNSSGLKPAAFQTVPHLWLIAIFLVCSVWHPAGSL